MHWGTCTCRARCRSMHRTLVIIKLSDGEAYYVHTLQPIFGSAHLATNLRDTHASVWINQRETAAALLIWAIS
uniref:Uncharacterized protein n=1 Tax=Oryza brachyantha TaxID=4533 RepID=J3LYR6_ORYBR